MNAHLDGSQELIVVDNASTDSPEDAASSWKGPGRFIQLDENIGFGAANNAGVAVATGLVAVLLNPDTELLDDGLGRLAAVAGELGALVGPRVLNTDRSIQPSASGPEVGLWPWVRALLPAALSPPAVRARTEPYRLNRRVQVSWLTGACVAAPTSIFKRFGPFDPALHMFGEDVDLGLRAGLAGVRSWFDPGICTIVHRGQGSSTLVYGSREGWRPTAALNMRAAVRRSYGTWPERVSWLALLTNLRLRYFTKVALRRATERDRIAVAAIISARPVPKLPPVP
jgi:N-acetylglucosaminyl-diphospho-decaprenol L-rhamnosyltransferase